MTKALKIKKIVVEHDQNHIRRAALASAVNDLIKVVGVLSLPELKDNVLVENIRQTIEDHIQIYKKSL